jgi:hypothetical protein
MPEVTAQEIIAKYKAKFNPEAIAWRWKLVKPLAVKKMEARTWLLAELEKIVRTIVEDYNLKFPLSAREWWLIKENWDSLLRDYDAGLKLWKNAGLPEDAYDDFFHLLKRLRARKQTITSYLWITQG